MDQLIEILTARKFQQGIYTYIVKAMVINGHFLCQKIFFAKWMMHTKLFKIL